MGKSGVMHHSCLYLRTLKLCVTDYAARSRLAEESGFARMSTQRPTSATGERPPPTLAPLNMAAIPPFQVHFLLHLHALFVKVQHQIRLSVHHTRCNGHTLQILGGAVPGKVCCSNAALPYGAVRHTGLPLRTDASNACKASRRFCAVVLMQHPVALH